jgi:DNA-binding transcriptional ArsR family regulator
MLSENIEKQKPNYYGILPATVRYDKELPAAAKILYSELTALTEKEGYCWASNKYFAELYEVEERTISRWISKLRDSGYIRIETENEGQIGEKRKMYITDIRNVKEKTHRQNCQGVNGTHRQNCPETHRQNCPSNITRECNTTRNIFVSEETNGFPKEKKTKNKNGPLSSEQETIKAKFRQYVEKTFSECYKGKSIKWDAKENASVVSLIKNFDIKDIVHRAKVLKWRCKQNFEYYTFLPSVLLNKWNKLVMTPAEDEEAKMRRQYGE